jgi:hypothetical protein
MLCPRLRRSRSTKPRFARPDPFQRLRLHPHRPAGRPLPHCQLSRHHSRFVIRSKRPQRRSSSSRNSSHRAVRAGTWAVAAHETPTRLNGEERGQSTEKGEPASSTGGADVAALLLRYLLHLVLQLLPRTQHWQPSMRCTSHQYSVMNLALDLLAVP